MLIADKSSSYHRKPLYRPAQ